MPRINHHDIIVSSFENLDAVYAILPYESRRYVDQSKWYSQRSIDNFICYSFGMVSYQTNKPDFLEMKKSIFLNCIFSKFYSIMRINEIICLCCRELLSYDNMGSNRVLF